MRLAGYQPQYFPRLHYMARILDADVFAFSDHVQFVRSHKYAKEDGSSIKGKSYQADTPIKTNSGIFVLSVPVKHNGFQAINQTEIAYNNRWQEKHLKGIQTSYAVAPYFNEVFPDVERIVMTRYKSLSDLNVATTIWALARLSGVKSQSDLSLRELNEILSHMEVFRLRHVVLKSIAGIEPPGPGRDTMDWIIDSCRMLGADEYYCGGTALTAYLDVDRLQTAGISVKLQRWVTHPYSQLWPRFGFSSNLSILDLLMNMNPVEATEVLLRGHGGAPLRAVPGSGVAFGQ